MVIKVKGETPTLSEQEGRCTNLTDANKDQNPNRGEVDQDVISGEEQDVDAKNCVEEKEDVNSVEEEEDANSEKKPGQEDREIGSEERSSHETPGVDDVQPNEEEGDKDEGSGSQTLSNYGDTRVSDSESLS
ncbi:hypothetical protein Bca101_043759 [Brassica carinata]